MFAQLRIDASSSVPIWSQIEEGVRRLIAVGALAPRAGVPSVRELARELRVNPATVSKAYQRLAAAGVLEVRRGDGTYVADEPPRLGDAERRRALREGAVRLTSLAATLGASREELLETVGDVWDEMTGFEEGERWASEPRVPSRA